MITQVNINNKSISILSFIYKYLKILFEYKKTPTKV